MERDKQKKEKKKEKEKVIYGLGVNPNSCIKRPSSMSLKIKKEKVIYGLGRIAFVFIGF